MVMVNVDAVAACLGGPAAQADLFDPKVGGHLALFCIHPVNRLNFRSGYAMMFVKYVCPFLYDLFRTRELSELFS